MATVTGLTAERLIALEDATVVDAKVEAGHLILITNDGTEIDVGSIAGPAGPQGPQGPPGLSQIPGEVRLWSGGALPDPEIYGTWVWANGSVYVIADHPIAAAHIATAWKTFDGASDPGAGNFRVPDLRGLVPAGLDQMPLGARANRMTRAAAIVLASKTGKETHVLTLAEAPGFTATHTGGHLHTPHSPGSGNSFAVTSDVGEGFIGSLNSGSSPPYNLYKEAATAYADMAHNPIGGGGAHETVQPTVMVPYIVHLDGDLSGGT